MLATRILERSLIVGSVLKLDTNAPQGRSTPSGDRYSFLVMHDYDCRIASCASKGKAKAQLSLRHQAFNVTKPEIPALITSI
jgi:hypothetical protein